jgi:lipopolysaccharide cholinephosphotransferase
MKNEISIVNIKNIQLELLDAFVNYCSINSLRYYLYYGSLLGAVRHKGYIPWDDDIDLAMPRRDYEYLINNFTNSSTDISIVSIHNNSEYPIPFAKLSFNQTDLVENIDLPISNLGINIDIFPIDGLPKKRSKIFIHNKKIGLLKCMVNIKVVKISNQRNILKNILIYIGKFLLKPIKINYLIKKTDNICKSYDFDLSNQVVSFFGAYKKKEIMPKASFNQTNIVRFEDRNLNAPGDYDFILGLLYGDYMKIPKKINQKSTHDFKVYKK